MSSVISSLFSSLPLVCKIPISPLLVAVELTHFRMCLGYANTMSGHFCVVTVESISFVTAFKSQVFIGHYLCWHIGVLYLVCDKIWIISTALMAWC
jgi:hypothetical protein